MQLFCCHLLWTWLFFFSCCIHSKEIADDYSGRVVKGNRNALFLIENGARRQFPDFFTFDNMGFKTSSVMKIKDDILTSIPIGPMIKALPQPPPFRPDDYMYHEQCGDPDRMVYTQLYSFAFALKKYSYFAVVELSLSIYPWKALPQHSLIITKLMTVENVSLPTTITTVMLAMMLTPTIISMITIVIVMVMMFMITAHH